MRLYVSEKLSGLLAGAGIEGSVVELPIYLGYLRVAEPPVYAVATGALSLEAYEAVMESGARLVTVQELLALAHSSGRGGGAELFSNRAGSGFRGPGSAPRDVPQGSPVAGARQRAESFRTGGGTPAPAAAMPPKEHAGGGRATALERRRPPSFGAASGRGRIVCCFSSAGGVGKTFMSTNLACAAALSGIPSIVVDMDLGYGDVDIATGLTRGAGDSRLVLADRKARGPKSGWATVTTWREHARNLKEGILQHHSGLYVLPSYPYAGEGISASETEELLDVLADIFSLVVVDLGVNAFSPYAKASLSMADTVFIVAKQDTKSIGKVSHFLKQEGGRREGMKFVVNMVDPAAYYSPGEVASECGFDEYETVPLDVAGVSAATRRLQMVVQLKGSAAGEAVWAIAERHLGLGAGAPRQAGGCAAGQQGGGRGLFSGIMGIFSRKR